jgi:chemotaxis protein methyltransferase CheR
MNSQSKLDSKTFKKIRNLIYEQVGITLTDKKYSLVSARVGKRMNQLGIKDYKQYFDVMKQDQSGKELVELINVISTNTTHFFREEQHFSVLADVVKKWEKSGQKRFRIWCAASSSGEEPYTLVITLKETLRYLGDAKILATDIDTNILSKAKHGTYHSDTLKKMPGYLLGKYFDKVETDRAPRFRVKNEHKSMLKFGRLNLNSTPYPLKGPLDAIFCRNVMIYFDNSVREKVLKEMYRLLKPGGLFFVGHAESLSGMLSDFKYVAPAVYTKN